MVPVPIHRPTKKTYPIFLKILRPRDKNPKAVRRNFQGRAKKIPRPWKKNPKAAQNSSDGRAKKAGGRAKKSLRPCPQKAYGRGKIFLRPHKQNLKAESPGSIDDFVIVLTFPFAIHTDD